MDLIQNMVSEKGLIMSKIKTLIDPDQPDYYDEFVYYSDEEITEIYQKFIDSESKGVNEVSDNKV